MIFIRIKQNSASTKDLISIIVLLLLVRYMLNRLSGRKLASPYMHSQLFVKGLMTAPSCGTVTNWIHAQPGIRRGGVWSEVFLVLFLVVLSASI